MRPTTKSVLATVIIALAAVMCVSAQDSRPKFEVASVKPNKSGASRVSLDPTKGRFRATNMSLRTLIRYAYDRHLPEDEMRRGASLFSSVSGIQVSGGPGWIMTDRFDVEAKPAGDRPPSQAEMQLMVQSLLEDRFQLKTHFETREVPTYDLVVEKAGKLQSSEKNSPASKGMPQQPPGTIRTFTIGKPPSDLRVLVHTMYGRAVSMSNFVMELESWAGRPVKDKTNLTGLFDIHLEFSFAGPGPATDAASEPSGPSIFSAIQQELGLKLESAKGPVEVLVIDSVSKPTKN